MPVRSHGSWPQDPDPRITPDTQPADVPGRPEPSLILPAWRRFLESRWRQRLSSVTTLSLAYHDAAEQLRCGRGAPVTASSGQLRQLMREAVVARCALRDTEEALERLSSGSFGRCEQCGAGIPVARLAANPESRYCARCEAVANDSPEAAESLPPLAAACGPA